MEIERMYSALIAVEDCEKKVRYVTRNLVKWDRLCGTISKFLAFMWDI